MALTSRELHLIRRLWDAGHIPARPRLVELGAQQLANDFLRRAGEIAELGRAMGVATSPSLPGPGKDECYLEGLEILSPDAPAARPFWQWLGFDYAAIDFDGGAHSIPLDLNFDSVPARYRGRFDLITNFGTTEHVANQLNAFKVIHDLTAVGGIMIHNLPSQGMVNHGLVNYNPKFIWYLARSNDYKIIYLNFLGSNVRYPLPESIVNDVKRYTTDVASAQNYLLADAGIHVILQKTSALSFVPPLDVTSGAKTTFPELQQRYWTVLDPASNEVETGPADTIRALQDMNRELQNANRELQTANHTMQVHLDAIRLSTSWRMTAPLRMLRRRLKFGRWSRLSR